MMPANATKYCVTCGESIHMQAEICPKCGVRQPIIAGMDAATITGKSQIAAGLFALFLGGFGIHYFYLGEAKSGKTILIATLISGVLSLVAIGILFLIVIQIFCIAQAITLLSMPSAEFARRYS